VDALAVGPVVEELALLLLHRAVVVHQFAIAFHHVGIE